MLNLDHLLREAQDLEPLPASALRLAALVSEPEVPIGRILEVVTLDQALTARLLRVANSAASASAMPIRTVHDAVVRLGNATVLALAVAGAARRSLRVAVPAYGLAEDQLWRHSVAAALSAECLAPHCRQPQMVEAFTAALLHDLGKLVLARFLDPRLSQELVAAQAERLLPRWRIEQEVLGLDHGRLGGLLAQRWGLPDRLARGIQFHHSPEAGADPLCDLVAAADQAARAVKGAEVPPEPVPEDHPEARARLGLTEEHWQAAQARAAERFGATLALLG